MNTKTDNKKGSGKPELPQTMLVIDKRSDFKHKSAASDKSAHTPGPWHTVPHSNGIAIHTKNGAHICGLPALLADSTWPNQANARLIAAAPDLFLACKFALEREGKISVVGQTLQIAIAKAEGKH